MDIIKSIIDTLPKLDKPQLLLGGFAIFCYSVLNLDKDDKKTYPEPIPNENEDVESSLHDNDDNMTDF